MEKEKVDRPQPLSKPYECPACLSKDCVGYEHGDCAVVWCSCGVVYIIQGDFVDIRANFAVE